MSYFISNAIFALVPADSQKNSSDVIVILYCVAAKIIGSSSLYGDDLINPLGVSIVAFEGSCVGTTADRKRSCGESATTIV